MTVHTDTTGSFWYLEGFIDSSRQAWRTVIDSLPISVGRTTDASLQLFSSRVSSRHAELDRRDGRLWIRDLASTNGTWVNQQRITEPTPLSEGDLIRFADLEFRLTVYRSASSSRGTATRSLTTDELSSYLKAHDAEFSQLLEARSIFALFQPVVALADRSTRGFELLSRGLLEGYETSPIELFHIAERLGCELKLSELCRTAGIAAAEAIPGRPVIFVNTHPAEISGSPELLHSLERLRLRHPAVKLALEVHEAAITQPKAMRELRRSLSELDIQLAFDDFGTGQSRLMEIAEVPPDYVKFDMAFVRDLDVAPARRREVLDHLVRMTLDAGVTPIAEGIETDAEEAACREVGFEFGQGFHLGLPSPVAEILSGD